MISSKLMTAVRDGGDLFSMITYHKGKGKAPIAPPSIAPAPPVEEASVEMEDGKKKRALTSKSRLKMPITKGKDVGLKGTIDRRRRRSSLGSAVRAIGVAANKK